MLRIDCAQAAERIEAFIRERCRTLGRAGAILGMSGGLDSSTAAALCARSLGREKVVGLLMPEKEGRSSDTADAAMVARHLGIRTKTHDLSEALGAMGLYGSALSKLPSRSLRGVVARFGRRLLSNRLSDNPLAASLGGTAPQLVARSLAHCRAKHRMRAVALYLHAELENLMVVGCANHTERMTGLFVRFGVDQCADIMPLGRLYRTQVLQLAEYLGLPQHILQKPPDPGIIPGVDDKYRCLIGLDSKTLDIVLEALDRGQAASDIARETGLAPCDVAHVQRLAALSEHMRGLAAMPEAL